MEVAIDQCTDIKQFDDNWALILQISDLYAVNQPKACLKYMTKKLYHHNPHICLKAITLLDACLKNAGDTFACEMSSKNFVTTFKSKYPKLELKPRIKFIELLKKCAEEYQNKYEFNLLSTLFAWVIQEHPSDVHALEKSKNTIGSAEKRAAAKEEEELSKAIALSLNEKKTEQSSTKLTPANDGVYTGAVRTSAIAPQSQPDKQSASKELKGGDLGQVRALFDFEAAEDNELTFKAEEIIVLLDESDPNWWRGRNHRGEGLFPAQFVTKDINVTKLVPEQNNMTQAAADKAVEEAASIDPLTIDPELLATCLQMLSDADSTGEIRPDPPEMAMFEAKARAMEPLIDRELQEADTRISEVTDLNKKLVDSLQLYHDLMSRTPAQPTPTSMYQMDQKGAQNYYTPPVGNAFQYGAPVGQLPVTGQHAPYNYQLPPQQLQQFPPSTLPVQQRPPMMAYQQVPQGYPTQVPYFPSTRMPTNMAPGYSSSAINYPGAQPVPYPGNMLPNYGEAQPQYYVAGQQQMDPRNPECAADPN